MADTNLVITSQSTTVTIDEPVGTSLHVNNPNTNLYVSQAGISINNLYISGDTNSQTLTITDNTGSQAHNILASQPSSVQIIGIGTGMGSSSLNAVNGGTP